MTDSFQNPKLKQKNVESILRSARLVKTYRDFDCSFQNSYFKNKCIVFFRIFKELFRKIDREMYFENIFWKAEIITLMTEHKLFSTYAPVIQNHRNW